MTSIDVVQVINMHVDQEHRSILERHEEVVGQCERGESVSASDNEVGSLGRSARLSLRKGSTDSEHDPTDRDQQRETNRVAQLDQFRRQ